MASPRIQPPWKKKKEIVVSTSCDSDDSEGQVDNTDDQVDDNVDIDVHDKSTKWKKTAKKPASIKLQRPKKATNKPLRGAVPKNSTCMTRARNGRKLPRNLPP
ncbi:MAG: hypothetical protein GY738_19360, partial [Pseudoalteromonas sp.]|nr:hypothetical protein [Pseudoalteromonas sp.]